jgi:hypothetical protein
MEKKQFELLTAVFSDLLKLILRVDIARKDILKIMHKISTGFEARNYQGKILNLACIGCDLAWLIEAAIKIPPPFPIVSGLQNPIKHFHFTGENLHKLADIAKQDLVAWHALHELLDELNNQNALPKQLTPSDIVKLCHSKPFGSRGPNPLLNRHRDALVIMLIDGAEKSGLGPISRSSTSDTFLSICDALARAFRKDGVNWAVSYDAIKTIWDRRRSLKEEIGAFRIGLPIKDSPSKEVFIGFSRTV